MNDQAGEHKNADVGGMDFFIGTFVWVDIIAGATFGPAFLVGSGEATEKFEYVELLKMGRWDLKGVMGCQTWAMIAVREITELERWRDEHFDMLGDECVAEMLARGKALENGLRRAIAVLQRDLSAGVWGVEADDSKAVSLIFSHAALVYLHVILSGPDPNIKEIQESAERCLQCIEALPAHLVIRICWPLTVAGCMAPEALYARFKGVVERMNGKGDGSLRKAVGVMEECWRLRSAGNMDGQGWWWRNVMEKLGVRILLT